MPCSIDQWEAIHELGDRPARSDVIDEHHVWTNKAGADVIELYRIGGMGHGTPIDTSSGYGSQAPYMLDVGAAVHKFKLVVSCFRWPGTVP